MNDNMEAKFAQLALEKKNVNSLTMRSQNIYTYAFSEQIQELWTMSIGVSYTPRMTGLATALLHCGKSSYNTVQYVTVPVIRFRNLSYTCSL